MSRFSIGVCFFGMFTPLLTWAAEYAPQSLEEIREQLAARKAVLLDVREPDEWKAGHLREAISVPMSQLLKADEDSLADLLEDVSKDRVVYLHCASGFRVLPSAKALVKNGYDARPIKQGYEDLVAAGFSQAKRQPAKPLPAALSGILLSDKRNEIERPALVLDRMELRDGDVVADIGAGVGFYSLPIAERIGPRGLVLAVDIQEGMLAKLRDRIAEQEVARVVPILGTEDDPLLPPGTVDWVILVDAYHEFSQPERMLERIADCLAPDGKVALLEYRAEPELGTVTWIPRDHRMSIGEVMSEWTAAGFRLMDRHDFLPTQHFFVFGKPKKD